MVKNSKLLTILLLPLLFYSCYTSTNLSSTIVEVLVPGKLSFTRDYTSMAAMYNNTNISYNPRFSVYFEDNHQLIDTSNIDSVASEIYFQRFVKHLRYQKNFDTVFELAAKNYADINISDSLVFLQRNSINQTDSGFLKTYNDVVRFAELADSLLPEKSKKSGIRFIDPGFCLFSKTDIEQIADSTGAELFLSLDFFGVKDGIFSTGYKLSLADTAEALINDFNIYRDATETVHIFSIWNFYDLKKQKLIYSHLKSDTVKWYEPAYNLAMAKRVLPSRWDAVLNAADVAGSGFAEYLAPFWLEVERDFYSFYQKDLKLADELIKENRWIEAAAIYRKNVKSRNKKTASRCMFNMAFVCEMNNEIDAAIDWLDKSVKANHKDPYHKGNCISYGAILDWRKLEIQKIEN